MSGAASVVLPPEEWQAREAAHRRRVTAWVEPRLARRRVAARDPVSDFLFDYYSFRPGQLLAWHPGLGVVLRSATDRGRHYRTTPDGLTVDPAGIVPLLPRLQRTLRVLTATAGRPAVFRCFGMHEWAMVLGLSGAEVRHPQLGFRVDPAEVAGAVAGVGLACTHFDAYRFFTPDARRTQRPLTREGQERDEQPGCVHVTMDLYRAAYEASPLVPSELVADCFALAQHARQIDMRASPYDLSALGLAPVPVETPAGRREYAHLQRHLAAEAAPLRQRVTSALAAMVAAAPSRHCDVAD